MLELEKRKYRDRCGLARALTGNIEGAIEDFQASVNWMDEWWQKALRAYWINALRTEKNPFTPPVLEKLRKQ